MTSQTPLYIWQQTGWPALTVQDALLGEALDQARLEQGRLLGLMEAIDPPQALEAGLDIWVRETLASRLVCRKQPRRFWG